jgi:DNA polymerase III delta subunit
VESAVLNVARFDVSKLGEAIWSGQVPRTLRMLAGLQAEGEAAVLVHWTWPKTCARWRAPAARWTKASRCPWR